MPGYIPFHLEIIYFTGFLEIIFSLGLWQKEYRKLFSYLVSLFFIAILPPISMYPLTELKCLELVLPTCYGAAHFSREFLYIGHIVVKTLNNFCLIKTILNLILTRHYKDRRRKVMFSIFKKIQETNFKKNMSR